MERQAITALLAVVLVFTQPFAPLIGTAAAEPLIGGDDKCSRVEGALYVVSFQQVAKECAVENQVENAVDEVKEADKNQTKLDIYSGAVAQEAATEPFMSTIHNRLEDSKTVAWTKGEVELARAYQNGTSLAVARANAKEAEDDYYSTIERNILADWRAEVSAFEALNTRAATENISHYPLGPSDSIPVAYYSGSDTDMLFYTQVGSSHGASTTYHQGIKNKTVTLANGTTVEIPAICYDDTEAGSFCVHPASGGNQEQHFPHLEGIAVNGNVDSSTEDRLLIDYDQYSQAWQKSVQMNKEVKNETNTYADQTYEAFQSGKIEPTDVISKVTAIQQYGTGDGSMSDVIAALSKMGLASPELNQTGVMTVNHDDSTYTGIVMAEQAPGGSWETNTTYDAGNISGPVWVATTGGESVDLDGRFSISEMKNKDGETIKRVNTTKYVYKTSNTTDYAELLARISDLRQDLEEREPEGGGGGDGSGGGINIPELTDRQLIVIVAVVLGIGAISALANRD